MNDPFEIEVQSRFGKKVRADVFLPAHERARYPAIFCAAPYLKSLRRFPTHPSFAFRETGPIEFYLERGYAFVWADVPGSGRSEGPWDGVLVLRASKDQTDLDVICRLAVVSREGRAQKVTQGWLRGSHRAEDPELTTEMRPFHRHRVAEPMAPGLIYELRVELVPMSFLVRAGERLRLEISNTDSSLVEGVLTHWYGLKMGTDTYHHDARHPSRLMLHERPRA